jgi:UbiA prenyltransferase family protein
MAAFRDLVELVRAPAALSVPGDALAGAAAAGTLGARTAGLCASSVCLYWAGMAANDWADREIDAKERPERPVPSGRVPPGTALGLAAGLSAAGVALAGLVGRRRAVGVAAPLAGAVWLYDTVAKQTAAGPAAMAACRGLDVLLGAGVGRLRRAAVPALVVAAHTYTVAALSRWEVDGAEPPVPAATLAGTAAVALAAALRPRDSQGGRRDKQGGHRDSQGGRRDSQGGRRDPRRVLVGGLASWYARDYGTAQARAVAEPSAGNIRSAVGAGITGLPALQGALIARAGAPVTAVAVAAAAPVGRRLARRVSPT